MENWDPNRGLRRKTWLMIIIESYDALKCNLMRGRWDAGSAVEIRVRPFEGEAPGESLMVMDGMNVTTSDEVPPNELWVIQADGTHLTTTI